MYEIRVKNRFGWKFVRRVSASSLDEACKMLVGYGFTPIGEPRELTAHEIALERNRADSFGSRRRKSNSYSIWTIQNLLLAISMVVVACWLSCWVFFRTEKYRYVVERVLTCKYDTHTTSLRYSHSVSHTTEIFAKGGDTYLISGYVEIPKGSRVLLRKDTVSAPFWPDIKSNKWVLVEVRE